MFEYKVVCKGRVPFGTVILWQKNVNNSTMLPHYRHNLISNLMDVRNSMIVRLGAQSLGVCLEIYFDGLL